MSDYTEAEIAGFIKEIDEANDLVWNLRTSPKPGYDPEKIIGDALKRAQEINYPFGAARCLLNSGMGAFILRHDFQLSEELINEAITIFTELGNEKWIANSLLTNAIIKNSAGKPESALYLGLRGIEFYLQHPNDFDYPMSCYVVGTIYKDLKKNDEAEKYYRMGISIHSDYNSWNARIYAGLSNILTERGEFEEALIMGQQGLELLRREDNSIGISRALNDIGAIYHKLKEYDKALEYIFEALEIRKKNNFKHFVVGSLIDVARIYMEQGKYEKSLPVYLEAEPLAIETNHPNRQAIIYRGLAECYKHLGELDKSVTAFEKLVELHAQITKQEKEAAISQTQSKLVKEKEDEIERLRNVELKHAYDVIAEKNKEITDSIHYANRIQKTILAPEEDLRNYLCDYFVYFQPKDIVSGDFYWSIVMDRENGDKDFYLAICDSTGHGVPGAFMSLLNTTYLNEAINEKRIVEPHDVLNYVRQRLVDSISKEGQKDGFDGILARVNVRSGVIRYAAANNAPLLIRDKKIQELPADKMPVGFGDRKDSFTLHTIELKKGDSVYLYTDGYADQFGGDKGKKFKYKPFYDLLCSIAEESSTEQRKQLHDTFESWKGSLEQVDDVCVVGFKIG